MAPLQSPELPVCSTVLALKPSIPTHGDMSVEPSPLVHVTAFWIQLAVAVVNVPPVTA